MAGQGKVRCGIELGPSSVKLVRGDGRDRLERVTHVGLGQWTPSDGEDPRESTAAALRRLLADLKLRRSRLGRIAVAITTEPILAREVVLPRLTEAELKLALPFEARKHLDLEGLETPVLDAQILGEVSTPDEPGAGQIRVLLVATSSRSKRFALDVLGDAGLEPEVIDLEPLAALNELLAFLPPARLDFSPGCLLNLGERRAGLYISQRAGGFLTRSLHQPLPPAGTETEVAAYAQRLIPAIQETATFYRGRHRQAIGRVFLGGDGATLPNLAELLVGGLGLPVEVLDPLAGLASAARGFAAVKAQGARFVTACGLCRWGDNGHV